MSETKNIESILQNVFGLSKFRHGQQEIMEHTLQKKNSLLLMPTGGGKSLCFQIPALIFNGLTLVISPLIALMEDQTRMLKKKNIRAQALHSNIKKEKRNQIISRLHEFSMLYISPERFRDKNFLQALNKIEINFLVIDEAHCISQWGHDFRPDYLRIAQHIVMLKNPVVMALTATATKHVQADILSVLKFSEQDMPTFDYVTPRENLVFAVREVMDESEKFNSILQELKLRADTTGIIYFTLIKSLQKFSHFLQERQISHVIFHGQLDGREKNKIYRLFKQYQPLLLLATNSFGMGVDRPDIRFIIHAEMPDSVEAYSQESGRAGRDKKKSHCILYFCQDDLAVQMDFLQWKFPPVYFIRQTFNLIKENPHNITQSYQELQENLVYKNKGDHRLQGCLSLFERHGITCGSLENYNLEILTSELPAELSNEKFLDRYKEEAQQRLISLVRYVRTSPEQRKEFLEKYFS